MVQPRNHENTKPFGLILASPSSPRHTFPLTALRRLENRIGYIIGRQAVAKCRRRRLSFSESLQEVRELMGERVLVADLQPRHPPMLHVGMVAVGDVDAAPAAHA